MWIGKKRSSLVSPILVLWPSEVSWYRQTLTCWQLSLLLKWKVAPTLKSHCAATQVSVLKFSITRIACVCCGILAPSLTATCKLSKANAFIEDTTQFSAPHSAHPYICKFVFMRYSEWLPLHVALFCRWFF